MTDGDRRPEVHPFPAIAGRPGLAQGRYGERGNLELVAPAGDGGIWVFWFNADRVERCSGAASGCWSGGLHFFGADEVRVAHITQMTCGPDYLEVAGCGPKGAQRSFWSPENGFAPAEVLLAGARSVSPVVETASASGLATVAVAVVDGDGEAHLWISGVERYPRLRWRHEPLGPADEVALCVLDGRPWPVLRRGGRVHGPDAAYPGVWRSVAAVVGGQGEIVGVDPDGGVVLAAPDGVPRSVWPGTRVDSVTAARTSLDGGRTDIVARSGSTLMHGHVFTIEPVAGRAPAAAVPVVSTVWRESGVPVHRRHDD